MPGRVSRAAIRWMACYTEVYTGLAPASRRGFRRAVCQMGTPYRKCIPQRPGLEFTTETAVVKNSKSHRRAAEHRRNHPPKTLISNSILCVLCELRVSAVKFLHFFFQHRRVLTRQTLDSPSEAACRGNSDSDLRDGLTGQSELPRYYYQSGFGMLPAPPETFEADEK